MPHKKKCYGWVGAGRPVLEHESGVWGKGVDIDHFLVQTQEGLCVLRILPEQSLNINVAIVVNSSVQNNTRSLHNKHYGVELCLDIFVWIFLCLDIFLRAWIFIYVPGYFLSGYFSLDIFVSGYWNLDGNFIMLWILLWYWIFFLVRDIDAWILLWYLDIFLGTRYWCLDIFSENCGTNDPDAYNKQA